MLPPPIHSSTHQCPPHSGYLHLPLESGPGVPKNQIGKELCCWDPRAPLPPLFPSVGSQELQTGIPLLPCLPTTQQEAEAVRESLPATAPLPGRWVGGTEERGPRAPPALPGVTGVIPAGDIAGRKGTPAAVCGRCPISATS